MAYIAVTYSFSNGTTSDATQVNSNFTDIINGLSDGTKDLNMNAATFAGNVTMNGNTVLGNAAGDTISPGGTFIASLIPNANSTYDLGSTTLGWNALYFFSNTKYLKVTSSGSMSANWTFTFPTTAGTDGYFLKTNGSGVTSWTDTTRPTIQKFTSSSGNYTTPTGAKWIRLRMVGSGGGGGASGSTGSPTSGGAGSNVTFGTCTAAGGGGGSVGNGTGSGAAGAGGAGTVGSGWIGTGLAGAAGTCGSNQTGSLAAGGPGAASFFGGGGGAGNSGNAAQAGTTNTGGGGGGAGSPVVGAASGSGGGSGGYVEAIYNNPTTNQVFAYAIGAAGTAGAAGGGNGIAGGAGGIGYIEVTEFYH